ncbi:DUF1120 domain-containing protein [Pseudomonas salomonii]|uniref:DUF1120 domain-containing protein n=2 Tax=Pseudomonas salomonii TaxID=191391 RepID=A0A1H3D4R3_9PSED|nr:DUF1120 domain-containing protein [Pseudomonas salomonii]SDX61367.1 Protein of unknown function [Pseudomonas salomonii]
MDTFQMKTCLSLLSSALLLAISSSAFAASSVDLTVKGLITPSACAPSLSNGGVIDHGKVAAKDLKLDTWTLLGNHRLEMAITCDAPTLLALEGIDNQGSAYDSSNAYGLGLVSGKKLGGYTLALDNPMADGAVISVIKSRDNGLSWLEIFPGDVWPAADLASFGDRSTGSWAPTPVQQVTAGLLVQTLIAPTAGMDLTTEVPIYGSATIEVKYL